MRLFIVGDVHWSEYSSILRGQGTAYSVRLESLIKTIDWCEKTAVEQWCDRIVYLGDFFDKPTLNDREISALSDVLWNKSIPHDFLVGNHESSVSGLRFSSTRMLEREEFSVRDVPSAEEWGDVQLCFLPYVTEDDRKPLGEYFPAADGKRVVLSHNDIKGISFGRIESKTGFSIEEIERNSDLYVNGHLHNGSWVTKRILNLGNITGQNFGEDAYRYEHHAAVLDTETLSVELIANPYALNFEQIDVKSQGDIDGLSLRKDNMVVNFRCADGLISGLKEKLMRFGKGRLIESRVTSVKEQSGGKGREAPKLDAIDGDGKFSEFMLDRLGDSETVRQEIMEVLR